MFILGGATLKRRDFNRILAILLIVVLLLLSIIFIELCSIKNYKTSLNIEKKELEMQNINLQFAAYSKTILENSKDKLCKIYIEDISLVPKNPTRIENTISELDMILTVYTVEQYRC